MKIVINNTEYQLSEAKLNYICTFNKPPVECVFNGQYYTYKAIEIGNKKYFIL